MKKNAIKILLIVFAILLIIILTFLKLTSKGYDLQINNKDLSWNIQQQGIKGSVDFTYDDNNNLYIAFTNKIIRISEKGETKEIIKNEDFNITSLEYYIGKLYFVTKDIVCNYNLETGVFEKTIDNLPNIGDYNNKIIRLNDDKIYISIGAVTNSGVVGQDNLWIENYPDGKDISPFTIILNGINFGSSQSGAFVPFNGKTVSGQKIMAKDIGTSTISTYDLKSKKIETYAYGIRNITGMDFNSNNKLIAAVGGMEDRGLRPVKGDTDYLYSIEKGYWYGFPDFSGGDPIDSPRFKDENNISLSMLIQNHPNLNPPSPLYVNKNLASISALAVDKEGFWGKMNNIYFIDKKDKALYSLNINGMIDKEVSFMNKININSIKFINKKLYALDSTCGNLLCFYKKDIYINLYDKKIIYGMIGIILVTIGVLSKVLLDGTKKKIS